LVYFLAMLLAIPAVAGEKNLTGAWALKSPGGRRTIDEGAIVHSGEKGKLFHRAEGGTWKGFGAGGMKGGGVIVKFADTQSPQTLILENDKTLTTIKPIPGIQFGSASRVSSLYVCGNHDPTNHAASAFAEMEKLRDQLGCAKWHSVDTKTVDMERLSRYFVNAPRVGRPIE